MFIISDINISESIEDKNTWFNVKRFKLHDLPKDFLQKTIDLNCVNKTMIENNPEFKKGRQIFEKTKTIKSIESINEILNEDDKRNIENFFGWNRWLEEHFYLLNFTFKFNPYLSIKNFEEIDGFFRYYYEYSKQVVLLPNIVKSYTPFDEDNPKKKGEKVEIISFKDYLKYVDELRSFMSVKNKKPIFVPISLKFSINEIKEMINHYLDKEYYNFWIDFESKPIGEIQTAMVKSINQLIKDRGLFKKTLTIFTNVRREIISKRKEEKSPASDVLGLLYGANLIGVDRDPPRPGTKTIPVKTQKEREEIFKHKAREFDGKSYYYYKTNDSAFLTKNQNVTNNAFRLGNELEKQKQYFLENKNIENYVVNKAMLREFAGGKILLDIRKGTGKQTALF